MQISFPTGKIKIRDVEYIFDEPMTLVPSSQLTPNIETSPEESKLQGTVIKTLTLKPYKADFKKAVEEGKYDFVTPNIDDFSTDIDIPETKIELVQFDRNFSFDDVVTWGNIHNKKLIETEHILTLGVQFPKEQRENYIAGGSVRHGCVLCLDGSSGWRNLRRGAVKDCWLRRCLVGFLSS